MTTSLHLARGNSTARNPQPTFGGSRPEGVHARASQTSFGLPLLFKIEVGFLGQEAVTTGLLEPSENLRSPLGDVGNDKGERHSRAGLMHFGCDVKESSQSGQASGLGEPEQCSRPRYLAFQGFLPQLF